MRYRTSVLLASWNAVCIGLVALAAFFGKIQPIFIEDGSHISAIVAGLMAIVLVQTTVQTFRLDRMQGDQSGAQLDRVTSLVRFLKNEVVIILGICGTLIGIRTVLGVTGDAEARMAAASAGLSSGTGASLVAMFVKLWCESIFFIKSGKLRELGWF